MASIRRLAGAPRGARFVFDRLKRVAVVTTVAVGVGGICLTNVNAQAGTAIQPTQQLALLLTAHMAVPVLVTPSSRGTFVPASGAITGEQTVLPIVGHASTADGVEWLRVRLPGRPNGSEGWIKRRGTVLTTTRWHIVVRTASRRVFVYLGGRLVQSFSGIVGKPSTPTPRGQFFVEESVRMLPGSTGGPFALALSARSNVLQEFEGGSGQIAIHGMMNLRGTPGTAVSHGCVRLDNHDIRWLAARVTTGVPVTIA
jgi:lipoprotein-anchoring transpeptidase ErfK/SrfK